MGLRFQRRIKIAKGITLNLSKSGVSASFGRPGLRATFGPKGTRTTVGIPGTGISYSEQNKSDGAGFVILIAALLFILWLILG